MHGYLCPVEKSFLYGNSILSKHYDGLDFGIGLAVVLIKIDKGEINHDRKEKGTSDRR